MTWIEGGHGDPRHMAYMVTAEHVAYLTIY